MDRALRTERRAAPRYDARALALAESMGCRVNPGDVVSLANVSSVGACVESTFALLPGHALQLHVQTRHRRATIETRVVWCAVAGVLPRHGVRFTAGLAFARWVDLAAELSVRLRP